VSDPASGSGPLHGALLWAVRRSFLRYVASLPDGAEHATRGAIVTDDGRIVFPSDVAASSSGSHGSVYAFRGTLVFAGHNGMLNVELSDPHVHVPEGGRGTVSVSTGAGGTGERAVIAAFAQWEVVDGRLMVPAPRLTWSGVALLGGVYEVAELLDPIEISPHPS
jgi:hypothetical protein